MIEYHDLLKKVLEEGEVRDDRTNTGTIGLFGAQMRFDLREGFPAITTKKLAWKAVVSELMWFIEGSNDERRLAEILYEDKRENLKDKTTIWTANAKGNPILGPVYGVQLRSWSNGSFDQLSNIIDCIKKDPYSRRHFISFWNPVDVFVNEVALPPCHISFQFYVTKTNELDCHFYMRSNDLFLGAPFNIASYALLTHIVGKLTGYQPRFLIQSIGDAHIYSNHVKQVEEQLSKDHLPAPTLMLPSKEDLETLVFGKKAIPLSGFVLKDYKSHPPLKAPMAV
jgi:thymidylate synthase